jgi:hypothetical protein
VTVEFSDLHIETPDAIQQLQGATRLSCPMACSHRVIVPYLRRSE